MKHRSAGSKLYSNCLIKQFKRSLSNVDYVSFDLFDTLVQRDDFFSPKDLFYKVEESIEQELGLKINNFATSRVNAEGIARTRAWGKGIEEITLTEIYRELARLLQLDKKTSNVILEIELEIEKQTISVLKTGLQLFEMAIKAEKRVIIVTDTYFDKEFIKEVVNNNGYQKVKKIYSSSAYRKSKFSGSLYQLILQDLRCPSSKILHIGDNQLSDVTMALNYGIRALLFPTYKNSFKRFHSLNDGPSGNLLFSRILCSRSKSFDFKISDGEIDTVLKKVAVENFSLLFLGFSTWLVEKLRGGNYKRIYFASRDGLIMKKFFDLVANYSGQKIETRYIYVSRASLYPSLVYTDPVTARQLFSHSWDILTLENALKRLSIRFEEWEDRLVKHGLTERNMRIDYLKDESASAKFSEFLIEIWPFLEKKYQKQFELLVKYLKQEQFLNNERVAFVDIGWHGSLQNSLLKLLSHLKIPKDLNGFYLGTFKKPENVPRNFKAQGYLINNDEPKLISKLIRCGPSVLEIFHSAPHGGVLAYKQSGTKIIPELEENITEQNQYKRIIAPIQNQAYRFIKNQLKRNPNIKIKASAPLHTAKIGLRFLYDPTEIEASTFGNLKIASDLGGPMKSITGVLEWNLKEVMGDKLPDNCFPMWSPGFKVLKEL